MKPLRLTLLALALAAGCATKPSPQATTAPIRIGAVLPLSGNVALYGAQARVGLDLAAKEINAGGGILGRPVEVVYADDQTDPKVAARAVRRLVDHDRVFALVGPVTSTNLNVVKPFSEKRKVPLLYATNYEGGQQGRYFFCLNTVPSQELGDLLPFLTKNFGKTYFLLGADHVWPHRMFDAAEPLIARLGGRVVGREYTLGTEKDFTPLIRRIAASKAKVLLFALKGDGLDFINQARRQGLLDDVTVAFLGLSEVELPLFHGRARNLYVTVPFVASSSSPAVKDFVARVKADAGPRTVVSHYVAAHANALFALKAALEKAGRADREAVVDALDGLTIPSPTGPLTIGRDHHSTMNLFLARAAGTRLETVRALGEVAPQIGGR